MFIKLREFWVTPKIEEGEPVFDVHTADLFISMDKVHTFNQVLFHDSHTYEDIIDRKTGKTIPIPRTISVDSVEYEKVTKIWLPIMGRTSSIADYIYVLETPEQIMEKIYGASVTVEPLKKKKGRPPGSKNKTRNDKEKGE